MISKLTSIVKKALPKSAFSRGVSVLIGGTASAQLLSVLAIPFITRLYSPDDFGLLAAFTAFLAFFTVLSAARFDLAIPLPESDQDAANLLVLGASTVTFITAICAMVFLLWPSEIAYAINTPVLEKYLWLIPIAVFFGGMYQLFSKWAVRDKKFGVIAKTSIAQTASMLTVQLGGYALGSLALLLGHSVGQAAGTSNLARSALKEPVFKTCSLKEMRSMAVRYKQFPIYSTWTALFNTASLQLAPLIFIALFGASVAGLYALTLRVLTLPTSLIGNAIGSVFLSTAPQAHREGTLAELVKSLHAKLSLAGAAPLVVLLFFGPDLFALVFGEQWRQAGVYSQWMAPWIYLQFQWSPLSMLASVLELQRAALISQLLTFISRFGVLVAAWQFSLSADDAIFLFAIISAIAYLLRMLWFTKQAGVSSVGIIVTDIKYLVGASLMMIPVLYVVGLIK